MYHQPPGPGQHWNPPQHSPTSHPPNGTYPPRQVPPPPGPQYPPPRPDMTATYPQQPDPYRLPAPHEMYRGPPPPHDPYRPPPQQMPYPQHQPAPRQRTAIACRYCRRRKIRCSGFESSEDGRCTNCQRFSQECIFTPVSAQTQAFVPAHTVWRNGQQPPPLYGAYGQPLPPQHQQQDPYAQPPRQGQQPPSNYALPSPQSASSGSPYASYDDRSAAAGRKRPAAEPHTPTLPPPNPASSSHLPQRTPSTSEPQYTYPDPTVVAGGAPPAAVSPASSNASYHSAQPGPPGQQTTPYYTTQPQPRRSSPQSAYSYDPSRASSSPRTQGNSSTPGGASYASDPNLRPPQNMPIGSDGRTPPPQQQQQQQQGQQAANGRGGNNRSAMSISDIVSGDGSGNRTAADNDMVRMLDKRGMP